VQSNAQTPHSSQIEVDHKSLPKHGDPLQDISNDKSSCNQHEAKQSLQKKIQIRRQRLALAKSELMLENNNDNKSKYCKPGKRADLI